MNKLLYLADGYSAEYMQSGGEIDRELSSLGNNISFEILADPLFQNIADTMSVMRDFEQHGINNVEPSTQVLEKLADKDILIVHWSPVNKKVIDSAPNLKFIGSLRSGLENIDVEYAQSKGIVVKNCPGRLANSVADLTLAFILQANKALIDRRLTFKDYCWPKENAYHDEIYRPMCMLTVGLIGFGAAAQAVAKRLSAFGCKILAYDPFVSQAMFDSFDVLKVDFDTVLKESDVISVHACITHDNKGMIGEKEFSKMKTHSIFINTARADLVDEQALINALKDGKIAGAGLDVFSQEPLQKNNELLKLDNVVLTPHIGGVFPGMIPLSLSMLVNTLNTYLKSKGNIK